MSEKREAYLYRQEGTAVPGTYPANGLTWGEHTDGERIAALSVRIDALAARVDMLAARVYGPHPVIDLKDIGWPRSAESMESEIESLRAENAILHEKYRRDINEAAGTIKELQAEVDRLRYMNDLAVIEIARLQTDIRTASEGARDMAATIANLREQRDSAVADLTLYAEQRDCLKADAKLGALVRQMPNGAGISRRGELYNGDNGRFVRSFLDPVDAVQYAIKKDAE